MATIPRGRYSCHVSEAVPTPSVVVHHGTDQRSADLIRDTGMLRTDRRFRIGDQPPFGVAVCVDAEAAAGSARRRVAALSRWQRLTSGDPGLHRPVVVKLAIPGWAWDGRRPVNETKGAFELTSGDRPLDELWVEVLDIATVQVAGAAVARSIRRLAATTLPVLAEMCGLPGLTSPC
jgi:hypothetical protein